MWDKPAVVHVDARVSGRVEALGDHRVGLLAIEHLADAVVWVVLAVGAVPALAFELRAADLADVLVLCVDDVAAPREAEAQRRIVRA